MVEITVVKITVVLTNFSQWSGMRNIHFDSVLFIHIQDELSTLIWNFPFEIIRGKIREQVGLVKCR